MYVHIYKIYRLNIMIQSNDELKPVTSLPKLSIVTEWMWVSSPVLPGLSSCLSLSCEFITLLYLENYVYHICMYPEITLVCF